ncbi:GNAT family N-acetyltransferase [Streptomyces carpinensis]|uniref:N-acetyltransferase n=1 Tax=Streptomyces carpinensis TaxID=66369 RepID=A0ABV1W5I3_9ACTN|nr:N-acetyltransferase [Streptomyces carpinensis]
MPSGTSASGQDQFRNPEEVDLPGLYQLDHEAFGDIEGYPYFVLRQLFDIHRRDFLLLERDGILRGYALAVHSPGDVHASLLALGVRPEFQRHGHGLALLDAAVHHAKDAGARRMDLVVRPDNVSARRLYKRYGFRVGGFLADHYGPGRDRIHMSFVID